MTEPLPLRLRKNPDNGGLYFSPVTPDDPPPLVCDCYTCRDEGCDVCQSTTLEVRRCA